MEQAINKYTIHTDGSCLKNPGGPGGWAFVMTGPDGQRTESSGGEEDTTNNRMEQRGAIEGLEATPTGSHVTICSDSAYLVKTMTPPYQKRNKNFDLWAILDGLSNTRKVQWEWLRGHAGHPENERADALAKAAAEQCARSLVHQTQLIQSGPASTGHPLETTTFLTHIDQQGRPRMVDVSWKNETKRIAIAKGSVIMTPATLRLITDGALEKGNVISVASLAGVIGAKLTPQLIPLAHPITLDLVTVELEPDEETSSILITATATALARTGVEMEALVAVTTAALSIYDMAKAVDRRMRIHDVRLVSKSGGKSGDIVLE